MTNFDDFLAEQMQDEEFSKEYEALEPEFTIMQAMIDDQHSENTTIWFSECGIILLLLKVLFHRILFMRIKKSRIIGLFYVCELFLTAYAVIMWFFPPQEDKNHIFLSTTKHFFFSPLDNSFVRCYYNIIDTYKFIPAEM